MLKRYILGILIIAMVLVFTVPASFALAQSEAGCEIAHECLPGDSSQYIPAGMDFASANSMYLYNPNTGGYWVGGFYGMKALCSNYGGYWYMDDGGEYYNGC
jgi:hypothetical protein